MKKSQFTPIVVGMLVVLVLAGCVSASKMLERAESYWAAGQYASAIETALQSYEKAVDKNKEPEEISAAKAFLEERFPQANEYLLSEAERQLDGPDSEKADAWKTFETLVSMNRRVRDSIAGSFLRTENYEDQLQRAKEVAAQIKYVQALELISQDTRDTYIEAYYILMEVDSFVADFRDVRLLAADCKEKATLVIAVSNVELDIDAEGDAPSPEGVTESVMGSMKSYIASRDNGDFLEFITAGSAAGAADAGAVLYLELKGTVKIDSDTDDDLYRNVGQVDWFRTYSGNPSLVVTRVADLRTEIATAELDFEQEIAVSFLPVRQGDTQITESDYVSKYNSAGWVASQLNTVKSGLSQAGSEGYLVVWGELEYGGSVDLYSSADVYTAEGYVEKPVDYAVWSSTVQFVNSGLVDFLAFEDINLSSRLAEELSDAFLSDGAVKDLLSNIEG